MKIIDFGNEVAASRVIDPAAITTTGANIGTYLDTQGYQGKIKFTMALGAVSGTLPTLDLKVQDCDTSGGTYADITPATAFPQKVTAGANSVDSIVVDTRGCRRFLKFYSTIGGSASPTFTFGVVALGQKQTI